MLVRKHSDKTTSLIRGSTSASRRMWDGLMARLLGTVKIVVLVESFVTIIIYVIKWTFNTGAGTNNRVELMGVWTTLYLSKIFNIQTLQIIGDSKLVIDWCNGRGSLHSIALEGWKDRIKRLCIYFTSLSFQHTYRDFNKAADALSKRALKDRDHSGKIVYTQWVDNEPGLTRSIHIF
jgi:ribonuclease HI